MDRNIKNHIYKEDSKDNWNDEEYVPKRGINNTFSKVFNLYKKNYSAPEIAKAVGITEHTVYMHIKRMGLETLNARRKRLGLGEEHIE